MAFRKQSVVAAAILGIAVVTFWTSVVTLPPASLVGHAAAPWTDGVEYLDGAVVLARSGEHGIHVAGEIHPSRYPFGFSLVSSTWLLFGSDPAWAPHRANQIGGLLLLLWTAGFWWRRIGPVAAAVSALLLATLPAFVILCRSPLSEVWGAGLAVAGIGWLYSWAAGGPRSKGLAGSALLAASLWFRTSNALLVPFAAAALLARRGVSWSSDCGPRAWWRDFARLFAAGGASMIPLWIQNWRSLGHPFITGYDYWAPYWSAGRAFDLKFVVPNLTYYAREFLQAETQYTTANLYGHGSYVGPAFLLLTGLVGVGTLLGDRDRRLRLAWFFAAGALYFGAMTFYFFQDARLLFPLFLLAIPLTAAGWARLGARLSAPATHRRARATILAFGSTVLLAAAVVGWPAPHGQGFETFQWSRDVRAPSSAYVFTRQLARLRDPAPALVLTDVPPPYVHALLPPDAWPDVQVAPLDDEHLFRFNPEVLVFGAEERQRMVVESLESGRSVWALVHRFDVRSLDGLSPPPAGHAWEIVTDHGGQAGRTDDGGIARLVPLASE